MARKLIFLLACFLSVTGVVCGCKKKEAARSRAIPSGGYFATPFQTESEFITGAIVSDLAEQMYFAANHRLPDENYFTVVATEKGGTVDEPIFGLKIQLDPKKSDLVMDLKIDGPIWSPEVYKPVAEELAIAVGLKASDSTQSEDAGVISKLLDATPETIEKQNQEVSAALQDDFANPELHEKAALLLGAFTFREHSGYFYEVRSPLSRITAHLAMAQFLRGAEPFNVNGQMANALMLTIVGDEARALEQLGKMSTNDAAVNAMARALRARNTGDYRPLAEVKDRTPFESMQWFYASADFVDITIAWKKLSPEQQQSIDYVRMAGDLGNSVEIGNQLIQIAIPLEMREVKSIYELSHAGETMPANFAKVLNVPPEHCFQTDSAGKARVDVIGWGQWSMFFQRQLCGAVQQGFRHLNSSLDIPDDAKEFASRCQQSFGGLTLYPLVRRFNCTDENSYHKAVDDGFKLTVAMPQFVPAMCWNYLCYHVSFAPPYDPNPNPHVNEWHNHNPPPGTVYDLYPRLDHPSLTDRGDAVARFEALHEMAPYDCRISNYIIKHEYQNKPTYIQAMNLYHEMLPYSETALEAVAYSAYADPQRYEELMAKAAEIDPRFYYTLGNYVLRMNQSANQDKAASYYEKAYDADPDRVRASNTASWLVRYLLKHGRKAKAFGIAQEGGEVYSAGGLEAQALYFEETSNYDDAFAWYAKVEERYNDSAPLLNFCFRYKAKTRNNGFDSEVQKRMGKLFPKGRENVSMSDFKDAPADGVLLNGDSALMHAAGLKRRAVIVAAYGTRVHNVAQYSYVRESQQKPELDLIVWQDGAYVESKSSPPGHLFGVEVQNYLRR